MLSETAGDLVVVDVGGATTDVHSIVEGPSEGNLDPQIRSRRTVEGDLGLYVSAGSVWRGMGRQGEPSPLSALPGTAGEEALSQELAGEAAQLALVRHAGRVIHGALLPDGRVPVRGRDLRGVGLVVGTGGGLAGLAGGLECLREAIRHRGTESLLPGADADVRIDRHYVFSACGTFARKYPDLATSAMLQSIGAEGAWS